MASNRAANAALNRAPEQWFDSFEKRKGIMPFFLRVIKHPLVQELRTLGHARQALSLISLLALVSLIMAPARTYCAEDIVRLLVKGITASVWQILG